MLSVARIREGYFGVAREKSKIERYFLHRFELGWSACAPGGRGEGA
jgi:hypothetical protein